MTQQGWSNKRKQSKWRWTCMALPTLSMVARLPYELGLLVFFTSFVLSNLYSFVGHLDFDSCSMKQWVVL